MGIPNEGLAKNGNKMHYSVGALIEKNGKYLLIDRLNPPYGYAGLAGHIDEGEKAAEALIREVKEESGLNVEDYSLIFEEEIDWNKCSKGIGVHYWYLFKCEVSRGIIIDKSEEKSIGWYTPDQIQNLKLEPVWEYWFKKMKIIAGS